MADTPEIPEAKDPFEKMVALSIAIIAVMLSFVSMKGDNAKTDAVIKTNETTNQWAFYQAKSLKEHIAGAEADILKYTASGTEAVERRRQLEGEVKRYKDEKEEIKKAAEKSRGLAEEQGKMNDRCDFAGLFLQIGIVIASVAILSGQRLIWYVSLALAAFGAFKFFF